jgi:hypothetical protein
MSEGDPLLADLPAEVAGVDWYARRDGLRPSRPFSRGGARYHASGSGSPSGAGMRRKGRAELKTGPQRHTGSLGPNQPLVNSSKPLLIRQLRKRVIGMPMALPLRIVVIIRSWAADLSVGFYPVAIGRPDRAMTGDGANATHVPRQGGRSQRVPTLRPPTSTTTAPSRQPTPGVHGGLEVGARPFDTGTADRRSLASGGPDTALRRWA